MMIVAKQNGVDGLQRLRAKGRPLGALQNIRAGVKLGAGGIEARICQEPQPETFDERSRAADVRKSQIVGHT